MLTYVLDMAFLISIACVGWVFFRFLRFPMPAFLGPMVAIVVLKLLSVQVPQMPLYVYAALQILLGLFIGSKMHRRVTRELKKMIVPAVIIITWTVISALVFGFIIAELSSNIDFNTAFLGAAMGGLFEVGIIALEVGADVSIVMFFQISRFFITIIFFAILFSNEERKFTLPRVSGKTFPSVNLLYHIKSVSAHFKNIKNGLIHQPWRRILFGIGTAIIGGIIGKNIGMPAGLLLGSMFLVAILNIAGTELKPLPINLHRYIQAGLGLVLGHSISPEVLTYSWEIYLIAGVMVVTMLVSSLLISYLIKNITAWEFSLTTLASAPAGLTPMVILAESLKIDPVTISILHLARMFAIKILVALLYWNF